MRSIRNAADVRDCCCLPEERPLASRLESGGLLGETRYSLCDRHHGTNISRPIRRDGTGGVVGGRRELGNIEATTMLIGPLVRPDDHAHWGHEGAIASTRAPSV
jgi:hypothetical protein